MLILNNGQEAWDYFCSIKKSNPDNVLEKVRCLITDIEMPQMDGHRLTKLIKSDPILKDIPVIIFSSLIDEALEFKGREVGADAQLAKPEIARLVGIVDEMVNRRI